jgi:hypothetical protein
MISSVHVIGEIFDTVHVEGSFDLENHNIQSTAIPAGGAVGVEMTFEVPGTYIPVDHSILGCTRAWSGTSPSTARATTTCTTRSRSVKPRRRNARNPYRLGPALCSALVNLLEAYHAPSSRIGTKLSWRDLPRFTVRPLNRADRNRPAAKAGSDPAVPRT